MFFGAGASETYPGTGRGRAHPISVRNVRLGMDVGATDADGAEDRTHHRRRRIGFTSRDIMSGILGDFFMLGMVGMIATASTR